VEVVRDRVVRQRGLAEVSVSQVLQIDPVADGQRLVEAVLALNAATAAGSPAARSPRAVGAVVKG